MALQPKDEMGKLFGNISTTRKSVREYSPRENDDSALESKTLHRRILIRNLKQLGYRFDGEAARGFRLDGTETTEELEKVSDVAWKQYNTVPPGFMNRRYVKPNERKKSISDD